MTDRMMQFFAYAHLKPELQDTSKMFNALASWVVTTLPENPERTVCLRKLLEAKDAAVRSRIYEEPAYSQTTIAPQPERFGFKG